MAVVKEVRDPYLQNVVSPDLLLKGVGKRLIEVCFLKLLSITEQGTLDNVLRFALKGSEYDTSHSYSPSP